MAVNGKGKGGEVDTASSSSSKRKGACSASASKRRRSGVLKFVDAATYVADDEEEEEDDDGDLESEDNFKDFLDELASEREEAPVGDPKGKGKSFLPFLVKEE